MKFSTSVIAALFGFGSLIRGLPQQVPEEQTVNPTTPNQTPGSSGDDSTTAINSLNEVSDSTDTRVPIKGDGSPDTFITASADISNNGDGGANFPVQASDDTETPIDQSYDTASAKLPDNPLGLPAKSWANDKRVMAQVKSGKLDFALYTFQAQNRDIVVSKTRALNANSNAPLYDFLNEIKRRDFGYALYHIPGQIIPVFFMTLVVTEDNAEFLKKAAKLFSLFNISLGLEEVPMEMLTDGAGFEHFLHRIGYSPTEQVPSTGL